MNKIKHKIKKNKIIKNQIISNKNLFIKINKIFSKKNYSKKDNLLFELYINLYLILKKKRKLAQIWIHYKINKANLFVKDILTFLNKYYPYYIFENEKNGYRFILHSKNYNLSKLNKTFSKKYAKDLGEFYVCAGDLNKMYKKYKYLLRPVISIDYENKYGKKLYFELFAQMCPPQICIKNFNKFISIKNKFNKYLKKINKKIDVNFELEKGF